MARRPAAQPTEAQFARQVIAFARLHGWKVFHVRPGLTRSGRWVTPVQGDGAGFVDLVLVRKRVIFAELKVGRNRTTAAQDDWLAALRRAGAEAHVWYPADWPDIEAVLGRGVGS